MSAFQDITTHISLYFGDGRVFFVGCFLVGVGVMGAGRLKSKWGRAFDYSAWLGMLLILISATPLAWEIQTIWILAFFTAMLGHRLPKIKFPRLIASICFTVMTHLTI